MEPTEQSQMEQNQNEQPEMSPPAEDDNNRLGPIVGVIIIVALIILGGLYMWNVSRDKVPEEIPDVSSDSVVQELGSQGSTDGINPIQADIDTTDLDTLDEAFAEIEAELGI